MNKLDVLGLKMTCASMSEVVARILNDITDKDYGYICAANVHMLMEANDHSEFMGVVNSAKMVCPDGMPLVWLMRKMGSKSQERLAGIDICKSLCQQAAKENVPIGFFGGDEEIVSKAVDNLKINYKNLNVVFSYSPEYTSGDFVNTNSIINKINSSGLKILFVALGCPKQEIWMNKHADNVDAVMVGVGAAVDFLAGTKMRAPVWMQELGIEWLFRLLQEPRRLFKRYVVQNSRFIILFLRRKYRRL